ncbi:22665_t:CDS:2, partial [Gigaspora margarita]
QWFDTLIVRKNLLLMKFDDLGQLTFIDCGTFGEVYSMQISGYGEKFAVKKIFKTYLRDSSIFKGFIKEPNLRPVIKQVMYTLQSLPSKPTYESSDFKNQDSIILSTTENSSQLSMAIKTGINLFDREYKYKNHIKNNSWYHHCEVKNFKQQFLNWTSNNSNIHILIRNLQLNFTKSFNDLKWIQFDRLINIKEHENAMFILEEEWIDEPMYLWNKDYEKADFGKSRPASARPQEINENMPFMAPEVIKEQRNTKTDDIYSLGMLMFDISFGHLPFIDRKYDVHLELEICNGVFTGDACLSQITQ